MKSVNRKRKGSAFPKQRDAAYRRWVRTTIPCVALSTWTLSAPISPNDAPVWTEEGGGLYHRCWGPPEAAHIGKHQATGAPDRGAVVTMCRAAHRYYDEHRAKFYRVTKFTPEFLEREALRLQALYESEHPTNG